MAKIHDSYGLEENQFIIGTEGGLVQKVIIPKVSDRDVRDLLTVTPNVAWSEEAMGFMSNISDQRNLQKIKDHVD